MQVRGYLTGMNTNILETIPLSPMRFKRCGECGCAEHKGANGSGHSTACSGYHHMNSTTLQETKAVTANVSI